MRRFFTNFFQKTKQTIALFFQLLPLSLLAGTTGILLFFVCTPNNFHALHWFAFLPLFLTCHHSSWKRNFYMGWCTGLVANFLIFFWILQTIRNYGGMPSWLAYPVGAVALFFMASWGAVLYGLLALLFSWTRLHTPKTWYILVPSAYTFLEFFFPDIFPYFQGCGQFTNLPLLQSASIFGVSGLTFLVLWSNCLFYEIGTRIRQKQWKAPVIFIVIWLSVWLTLFYWGKQRIEYYDQMLKNAPKVKVAMIQSGWSIEQSFQKTINEHLQFYLSNTQKAQENGAQFVIWPESSIPTNLPETLHQQLADLVLKQKKIHLVYGGNLKLETSPNTPPPKVREHQNTAFVVGPDGKRGHYGKMIRVPFGEYTPFADWFPFLKGTLSIGRHLIPGTKRKIFPFETETKQAFPFGIVICYEAILHSFVRKFVQDGARLMVNITVDSWFKYTHEHHQHLMLAGFNTVQLGVGLLRTVDSGITCYIDPLGRVHQPSPIMEPYLWEKEIALIEIPTPIRTFGFWFPYACLIGCLFLLFFARIRKRAHEFYSLLSAFFARIRKRVNKRFKS